VLVSIDLGLLTTGAVNGYLVTLLVNLNTGEQNLEWLVSADLNNQVQVMTVDRSGPSGFLEAGNTDFNFVMVTYDIRDESVPRGIYVGRADLTKGSGNNSFGLLGGTAGITHTVPANRDAVLWLYSNNVVGEQYQIIKIAPGGKGGKSGK
jgi:hypothetical protein